MMAGASFRLSLFHTQPGGAYWFVLPFRAETAPTKAGYKNRLKDLRSYPLSFHG